MFGLALRASFGVLANRPIPGGDPGALLHVQDQKADTINGGASSAGANTRDLNTVVGTNEIFGSSIGGNRITLPSGTYWIEARAPCNRGNRNRLYWFNFTDSDEAIVGSSSYAVAGNVGTEVAILFGQFSIGATKAFELRHYIQSTNSAGLGVAVSDDRTNIEIYADVRIIRVSL